MYDDRLTSFYTSQSAKNNKQNVQQVKFHELFKATSFDHFIKNHQMHPVCHA